MEVTLSTATQLGLTEEEYEKIKEILGRNPNFNEISAYSVMWSEHCSYKNSIKWLKTLPREGGRLLVKAGEENAGLMDIGDGLGLVFKIESHNHPSAVEPFQGAATGVGGIHRDIFTMGARPVAALNSLRFGNPEKDRTQYLINGVVKGIGHYGNCFGVPTVGGEVYFEECYHTNPLVNAMGAGILRVGESVSAIAEGEGNPVFIAGSATGKDGIGGAAFASADLHEDSAEDLPSVQVGDPFQEKKLLEACLEIIHSGALVGMQDMGAAGIICSTSETSAKGNVGMDIDLEKVPTRQKDMKAWELLLSESQERMLLIVKKGREKEVLDIFEKWDLPCSQIGTVNNSGILRFYMHGELEAEIPAESLVLGGGAPVYDREYREPKYFEKIKAFDINTISQESDLKGVAEKLITNPNIASKKWIYDQYDSMVGGATMNTNDPSDAAVVWIQGTKRALAFTTDCNSRYVFADPFTGCMIAVAEAARNIVCSGGKPLGISNCLNFGNPYDPEVYYQFVKSIQGMSEACKKFDTPVTGGNVSFYNQSPDGPVYPTPVIAMAGILDSLDDKMSLYFKNEEDLIYLVGKNEDDLNSSEYLHKIKGIEYSPAPYFNLEEEFQLHENITKLIQSRLINSAHDLAEGGLFVALAESAFYKGIGFKVNAAQSYRKDAYWFGEAQGRVVVTVSPGKQKEFEAALNVPFELLGTTGGDSIIIDNEDWGKVAEWHKKYVSVLTDLMSGNE
ncbi:MAG: phosphoribosylformylglycinamidine synthase subunit PurL [Chitinophagaceae bacterium]|nr:phosphoribosylformylglycinamidine synthase subunit PurL [Chitinophagaceae bacterium]